MPELAAIACERAPGCARRVRGRASSSPETLSNGASMTGNVSNNDGAQSTGRQFGVTVAPDQRRARERADAYQHGFVRSPLSTLPVACTHMTRLRWPERAGKKRWPPPGPLANAGSWAGSRRRTNATAERGPRTAIDEGDECGVATGLARAQVPDVACDPRHVWSAVAYVAVGCARSTGWFGCVWSRERAEWGSCDTGR
jgi:hypothetical protein